MPEASVSPRTYLFSALDPAAWAAAERGSDPAVLVCDGVQTYLQVRGGHLQVTDGPPDGRRTRKLARVPRTVSRVMVLGSHGYATFEALRWMTQAGITYTHIDRAGRIVCTSGPQREDARLLRAQAFATENGPLEPAGLKVTQALISVKLEGQARNLDEVFRAGNEAAKLRDLARWVRKAETLPECRTLEAQGAAVYWQTWAGKVRVPFSPGDLAKVPAHWLTYAGRTSLGSDYQRNKDATDPVNAMLNFAYRVGETEATHACHAIGLHPALGILHSDKQGRDSFALDLLEAIRPTIDRVILGMMDTGLGIPYGNGKPLYLDRRQLEEESDGTVRLEPPLTHTLASHAAEWGAEIRTHADTAARVLALAASGDVPVPRAKQQRATKPRVPVSSSKRARLREGTGPAELLPDHIWRKVAALIPAPPKSPTGRTARTGRPVDAGQDRAVIAGLAAHELLGVPWTAVPVPVSSQLCQARFKAWSWLNAPGESRPAWEAIAEVLQASGHLSGLPA